MLVKNLKSKIKSKDLKKGMIVGWVEEGYNECEGVIYDHEMVNSRSITFNSPLKLRMTLKNTLFFEKSKLELN